MADYAELLMQALSPLRPVAVKKYAEGGLVDNVADFTGLKSPATVGPGLAQISEWLLKGAKGLGVNAPWMDTALPYASKYAGFLPSVAMGTALYSPDTASDEQEAYGIAQGYLDRSSTWEGIPSYVRATVNQADTEAENKKKRQEENIKRVQWHTKMKEGGMINGNNSFSPQNGILKGGLNLLNPKSKANGPFNIELNTNNMLVKGLNHG